MLATRKIWRLLAGVAVALGLSGAANGAIGTAAHDHAGHQVKLALDDGKKWATDEPLRRGMAHLRAQMQAALHEIDEGKLKASGYTVLADQLIAQVGAIVAQCKLEARADAQLHLIIAQIAQGVEIMQAKHKHLKRQAGVAKVLAALEQYGTYFDDSDWQTISH